jgi:putative endopeptidase
MFLPKPLLASAIILALLCPSRAADDPAKAPPPIDPVNLDAKVRPADDFYHYANGGWLQNNPIPPEFPYWGSFVQLAERNRAILHGIVDDCAALASKGGEAAPRGSIRQKVGDFYASGMDEARIDAEAAGPLAPEFERIQALKDRAELPGLIAHLHEIGVGALFNLNVDVDEKNSIGQIAQMHQGGLGLPDRDYYTKDDERSKAIRAQYEAHVAKIFALLGDAPEKAAAEAKTILNFETELAKASKTRVDLRDPESNYHKMSLADLAASAPGFDWKAYFTAISAPEPGGIDVKQTAFYTRAGQLADDEPLETWQTYLRWHLAHEFANDLSKDFVNETFQFYGQTLTGAKELRPRWKRILAKTDAALGEALGQLYVEKNFTPEAKARALTLINDLKSALRERLGSLEWMGPETRAAALRKLDSFGVKIGYPDKWRDYRTLEVKRQSHVFNVQAANVFEFKRTLAKIGQPVDKTEWQMTPPTVNAYYEPPRNEIVFPAGILQPPFFFADADDAINYGGIGAVIGHEMTHGFDDQGRQYDAEGNLKNWWTDEDIKHFKERSAKIVAQFKAYEPLPGAHVNGELTQGENIADLGGSKIAFAALRKALERQGPEAQGKLIDGFTPEQRFFLSWAQVWRSNMRPEMLRLMLNTDPHSPTQYRCNGPLSNMPEFQAAFGVPADSAMVRPENERVQIW